MLEKFAHEKGYEKEPLSGSWGQALIDFLKSSPENSTLRTVTFKSAFVSASEVETSIVASFINELSDSKSAVFQRLVDIFMGVLVEEFISSVSEIGHIESEVKLTVFYDTSVILRLLGCSGKLLKTATEELTRYLQDLGMQIMYLGGNESEVHGILDAILQKKDSGLDIEGETAAAVSRGEVTIVDLRMLQNTVADRLGHKNIFRFDEPDHEKRIQSKQINEVGFSSYLVEEAKKKGKVYSYENRTNDSGYLGVVMRLRGGRSLRDLLTARYIFITTNKFLVNSARRYLIKERQLNRYDCPPMLHVCQIATIAWLMKDHRISPERAGRDLLANCYAAFRPDAEWFRHFREKIEEEVGSFEEFAAKPGAGLTIQAARRIALDETLGHSALVRPLNAAELLARANEAADRERLNTAAEAREEGYQIGELAFVKKADERASNWARRLFFVTKILVLISFFCCLLIGVFTDYSTPWIFAQVTISLFAFFSAADLLGFSLVSRWLNKLEKLTAQRLARFLRGG